MARDKTQPLRHRHSKKRPGPGSKRSRHRKKDNADIVIVGAGCAGAYAAWRLSQDEKHNDKKIRVYELLPRVGGRLISKWMSEMVDSAHLSHKEKKSWIRRKKSWICSSMFARANWVECAI